MSKLVAFYLRHRAQINEILEMPWVKAALGFLSGLFKRAGENPAPHPGRDNPDKPVTPDDITNQPTNV